jgi:uncharacterized membrane protein HdeD (DUF308 family)
MIQTIMRKWWLLAVCGVLDAVISAVFLNQGFSPLSRFRAFELLGWVTLAAGICTIAAGIFGSREGKSWLLVLNGFACCALGAILSFGAGRRIAFRTIALLIFVMAVSIGVYELVMALRSRRHHAREWLLGAAGIISVGFAFVFLSFVLRWIKLDPSPSGQTFYWIGSYFAFTAIGLVGLFLDRNKPGHLRFTPE